MPARDGQRDRVPRAVGRDVDRSVARERVVVRVRPVGDVPRRQHELLERVRRIGDARRVVVGRGRAPRRAGRARASSLRPSRGFRSRGAASARRGCASRPAPRAEVIAAATAGRRHSRASCPARRARTVTATMPATAPPTACARLRRGHRHRRRHVGAGGEHLPGPRRGPHPRALLALGLGIHALRVRAVLVPHLRGEVIVVVRGRRAALVGRVVERRLERLRQRPRKAAVVVGVQLLGAGRRCPEPALRRLLLAAADPLRRSSGSGVNCAGSAVDSRSATPSSPRPTSCATIARSSNRVSTPSSRAT